jgi:hypothetical protein
MPENEKIYKIEITHEEAILLSHFLTDDKINELDLIFRDRNISMIFARIVCDLESKLDEPFRADYDKIVKKAYKKTVERFGDMNILGD